MNKAFVREPDPPKNLRCPQCEAIGLPVGGATLAEHVPSAHRKHLSEADACFCPNPKCLVGYFDAFAQSIPVDHLHRGVYPKDPDAPICSCFSLAARDVIHDARIGNPEGVRMLISRSRAREAICRVRSPDGRCCIGEVQQLYLKHAHDPNEPSPGGV